MGTYAANGASLDDIALWLLPPDNVRDDSAVHLNDVLTEVVFREGLLLQDTLEVTVPWGTRASTATYSGTSHQAAEWEERSLELAVRGVLKFHGPIDDFDEDWAGSKVPGAEWTDPGSRITLVANTWFTHHMRRRYVATTDGSPYKKTDHPIDIFRDLIRTSMVIGSVVTPTNWQQGSETRDDMGSMTIAVSADSHAGTQITFEAEFGENLYDALIRLCNTPEDDAKKLWPTQSVSGTTVTYSALVGRSGGSREIGSDLSSTVVVSAERGNLIAYKKSKSRSRKENHICALGRGGGPFQRRRFKANTSDIATSGVYEGIWPKPSGKTNEEVDQEAALRLFEYQDGTTTHEFGIVEVDGFLWPIDWGVGDNLGIYTPSAESVTPFIIGVEWRLSPPGPAEIKPMFGKPPPSPEAETASRGGMAGGRGGGSRNARKSGEIPSWHRIPTQDGVAKADEPHDEMQYEGYDTTTYVRVKTHATDPGADGDANTTEIIKDEIQGDFLLSDPSPTGTVRMRNASGADIYLLATLTPPA